MNAEDYCEELLFLKEQCSYQRKRIERIRNSEDVTFIRSQVYDGSGIRSRQWKGGVFNQIEEKVDNLPAAVAEYKETLRKYIIKTSEFWQFLDLIKSDRETADMRHAQFLTNRYLYGMNLSDMADEMGLAYETVRRLKKPSLEALQLVLDQKSEQSE